MKKIFTLKKVFTLVFIFLMVRAQSQLLSWTPAFIQESSSSVTITGDATMGNKGLLNYTPINGVYVHIGVITNKNPTAGAWKYVPAFCVWGTANSLAQCAAAGTNKWSYTITGGLRTFFGITDTTEIIQKVAILFRSADGNEKLANADGSDMYVPVYDNGTYARIDNPFRQPMFVPEPEALSLSVGSPLTITGNANNATNLNLYFNGTQVSTTTTSTTTVTANITTTGNQQIIAEAINGAAVNRDTMNFVVASANKVAALPAGITDGINYDTTDPTAVTLVLYAPQKNNVYVIGDFNNWTQSSQYQMNVTPDSARYWIRLTGLTAGTEYAYQYLIDGSLRVADYNTEKVLDKSVDPTIPSTTYPNLKPFPANASGTLASIIQTGQQPYKWQVPNFQRPDKKNLMIYELWLSDFTAAGNCHDLIDTLGYLTRLGVNAIEVEPITNFEGSNSWGYNPNFYFAPDKVYGTATAVKQFVDACHQQGMAVIMDMVMNHSFGSSPMVQMYWDNTLGVPAANSPWFNQYPTHADNVGYQFNHESAATKAFTQRVINYWLNNYHVDGYRWDLAKGFTQTRTCDATGNNCDVNAWGAYDASRVAIWDTIYNQMQAVSPGSYCILEMFADNTEQTLEANYGMMLWGNLNTTYNQATMGYSTPSPGGATWDLSPGIYTTLGWNNPGLVVYQESHDEERLMYNNEQYGNNSGSYNIKDTATGLNRNAMATAFWAMTPGPKMLTEFGELGFDYSINWCANGTVDATGGCRLTPKPITWNYLQNANRKKLHDVYAAMLQLRNSYPDLANAKCTYSLSGAFKYLAVNGSDLSVVVVGNFDVVPSSGSATFPATGTWYNYLTSTSTSLNLNNTTYTTTLQPGEYYVYINKNISGITPPPLANGLSFAATNTGDSVLLNWSVLYDTHNNHYEAERSTDSLNFTALTTITAVNSTGVMQYSYTDAPVANGVYFYRIKETDSAGNFVYSTVSKITVNVPPPPVSSSVLWQVYPNPSYGYSGSTALHMITAVSKLELFLTDMSGRVLYRYTTGNVAAGQQVVIPLQNFSHGMYLLNINTDKGKGTEKIVVL
jgi:glycosidase